MAFRISRRGTRGVRFKTLPLLGSTHFRVRFNPNKATSYSSQSTRRPPIRLPWISGLPGSRLTCYDAASAFGASGTATAGTAFAAFFGAAFLAAFFLAFEGAADFSFLAAAHRLR